MSGGGELGVAAEAVPGEASRVRMEKLKWSKNTMKDYASKRNQMWAWVADKSKGHAPWRGIAVRDADGGRAWDLVKLAVNRDAILNFVSSHRVPARKDGKVRRDLPMVPLALTSANVQSASGVRAHRRLGRAAGLLLRHPAALCHGRHGG